METKSYRRPIHGPPIAALLSLLTLLLLTPRCARAQAAPPSDSSNKDNNNNNYNYYGKFNPTMAIVIVIMISAFFFLGFFSIYIRNCGGDDEDFSVSFRRRAGGRSRRQQGLSPELLETFPTLLYAEVKGLKAGKGALECAVCLSEFEDDEELRLLPHCRHVFHSDCIGAWLASHVTCPVCRANLAEQAADGELHDPAPAAAPAADAAGFQAHEPASPSQDHVAVVVDPEAAAEERKEAAIELARIGSQRRAARSRSGRRPAKFPRSYSTGHSVVRPVEDVDRYTLRLPEHIRKEIFAARKLHRSASCMAFPSAGEGSSRRGPRGEGSSRRWRNLRFGRSDRWPSFLFRTLSLKVPAWPAGRRREGEGSVRNGEGEGSTSLTESSTRSLTRQV